MFVYIIITSIYLVIMIIFQLKELMADESNIFEEEYADSHIDVIVFALSLSTIFIKLFAYYHLKGYIQTLKKRELLILDSQHEQFLDDLNNTFEDNVLANNNNKIMSKTNFDENSISNSLLNDEGDILDLYVKNRGKI